MLTRKMKRLKLALLALAILIPFANKTDASEVFEVDMAGWETFGEFDNPNNTQVTVDLFPNAEILSIEWIDLEFTTENGSWQSEFILSVNDSANTGAAGTFWDFAPAPGVDSAGTYAGSGAFDDINSEFGSGAFTLLSDGQATIYIYETFDDPGGTGVNDRDALVAQGTLRITTASAIPEPSSLAFIGCVIGGVALRRKKR